MLSRVLTSIVRLPEFSYFKHLQHLVAIMVDDLHGNLAGFRFVERLAHRAVQTAPSRCVDVPPLRPFEFVVGFVRPGEVGVTHEETLAIVVRVDEPAGECRW